MFTNYEVFDPSALSELYELQSEDDPNLVSELLRDYLSQLQPALNDIVNAFNSTDPKTVEKLTHTLKSSSRVLGCMRMGEVCFALEGDGHQGHLKQELLMSLRETANETEAALTVYLARAA